MAIIKNQTNMGHAQTLDIANNTYNLVDFANPNTGIETITGLTVTKIIWTGDWSIKRGTTVVWQTPANTFGCFDLRSMGIVIGSNNTANLVVTTAGLASSLILEVSKQGYALSNT